MIVRWLTATQYRRGLRQVEAGDVDAVLAQFHPACRLTFAGDTSLRADGVSGPDLRPWLERFLPHPRFEIQRLVISGPPWHTRLTAHVRIHSTVDGQPDAIRPWPPRAAAPPRPEGPRTRRSRCTPHSRRTPRSPHNPGSGRRPGSRHSG